MLKVNIQDLKHFIRKFHFLVFLVLAFGLWAIFVNLIAASIPGIFIFLFLLFEKYVLKTETLKNYNLLDIFVTALFYGFTIVLFLVFLSTILLLIKG
ncbi:hypothetical protein H6501_05370 [Candidatus Woesearchaeota archaeon]|nr:hypothetical protein [Nanoarchaeota archaeon]MCB9371004.1 hypothetical protein [Candidatus Woesearchaeota archaeon]USN44116.1 MAG: hypothetical protein H6500_07045 [Candidatus Woesearchaeota archaeon]